MIRKLMLMFFVLLLSGGAVFAKEEAVVDLSGKAASFESAHKVLAVSCMPCHSAQLPLPWYGRMPLVKEDLKRDYVKAVEKLNLDSQVYVAGQPPLAEALDKIERVVIKGKMPPKAYVRTHWSARLSGKEKQTLFNWIRDERARAGSSSSAASGGKSAASKQVNPFKPFST